MSSIAIVRRTFAHSASTGQFEFRLAALFGAKRAVAQRPLSANTGHSVRSENRVVLSAVDSANRRHFTRVFRA